MGNPSILVISRHALMSIYPRPPPLCMPNRQPLTTFTSRLRRAGQGRVGVSVRVSRQAILPLPVNRQPSALTAKPSRHVFDVQKLVEETEFSYQRFGALGIE
jgi:hypothetical protein